MIARRYQNRNALSLVELLVVIAVMTLLTAITLPLFKTVLKDRKTNQGAMIVRGMMEKARLRAIATGRPVAVVLERSNSGYISDETNGLYRVYLGAGGMPRIRDTDDAGYEGDAFAKNAVGSLSIADVFPPYTVTLEVKHIDDSSMSFYGAIDPTLETYLQPGNEMSIGDQPNRLTIKTPPSVTSSDPKVVEFHNPNATGNITQWDPEFPRRAPVAGFVLSEPNRMTVRIYSKPRKLNQKPIDLPKGICVDLSLSGVGNQVFDVNERSGHAAYRKPFFSGTRPLNPQLETDRRNAAVDGNTSGGFRFSSEEIYLAQTAESPNVNRPIEALFRPVYIVFNARGELAGVWQNVYRALDATSNIEDMEFRSGDSVFLMVGRTERVPFIDDQLSLSWRFSPPVQPDIGSNLYDSSNYWVRVSSGSGQVSMGINNDPTTCDPIPSDSLIPSFSTILTHCRKSVMQGADLSGR